MGNDNGSPRMDIAGKKAAVIGGSGGIGWAIAHELAAKVDELVLHGRDETKLAERAAELGRAGCRVVQAAADLSGAEPPAKTLELVRRCDLLVVAYGPFVHKTLAATSAEDWRLSALAGLALPGIIASEAAAAMAERGFGRILLFGGTRTDAIRAYRGNAAYAAAKTGLGVLAKSLAGEFGPRGVSSVVLCPGFVDTEYLDASTRDALTAASPRGHLIAAGDIAGLAAYLLSGGMDLVSGSVINADEGLFSW